MKKDVALIIVTHNRLGDLKDCLFAAQRQICQRFDIIVVNNGSTDGTREYLDSRNDLIVIHQDNLGGAGGFYAGQKYAFENGYDWIWMMDDDGLAEEHQLEELLRYANKTGNCFLNALVVDKNKRESLAFSSQWDSSNVKTLQKSESLIGIHPFNGTFIHRSVLERIGLIKKEMFIWGDEQEYTWRARAAGYVPTTVTSAIHFHPKEKGEKVYVFLCSKRFWILKKPKRLSKYFYRNEGFICKQYKHPDCPWKCQFVACNIYYYLRTLNWVEVFKFVKYYRRGIRNDYR